MRLTEQQVGLEMATLPERFVDRVPDKELRAAIGYRDAGEWAESFGALIAALRRSRTTITSRENRSLRDFLETFQPILARTDIGTRKLEYMALWLDELEVVPSLTEQQMIDRLRTIPHRFAGRIPPEEIESLTVRPDEEEPGIWFEVAFDLIEILRRHRVPVSDHERGELRLILDALDLPRLGLSGLPSQEV